MPRTATRTAAAVPCVIGVLGYAAFVRCRARCPTSRQICTFFSPYFLPTTIGFNHASYKLSDAANLY